MRLKFQNNKKMHMMIFFMTTNFLDSQESDVSLLAATVGIKSYQRGKKAGHIHRSYGLHKQDQ